MGFAPEDLGLGRAGLPLLRNLIHERTGIHYADDRFDMLCSRLAPLVIAQGFQSFLDFYYLLKYDDLQASKEWRRVMDALSVQETYFWREIDQIKGLACRILPELAKHSKGGPLRIWSVPCATGEEPLTIAMVLEEAGWFDRLPIEIHASDGSPLAIERARAARYRSRAFRALPDALREKYFVPDGQALAPVPSLSARVTSWSVVNLMAASEIALLARSPVIFCRNAFIYFSPESVKTVVEAFADLMPMPAYLFVGASESLMNVTDRFRLDDLEQSFVYVKR